MLLAGDKKEVGESLRSKQAGPYPDHIGQELAPELTLVEGPAVKGKADRRPS